MIALAIALTAVAGYVDAVGYLVLEHVFTANMSGNTIAIGIAVAQGDWALFIRRGSVIPLFVVGLLISRFAIGSAQRRKVRSIEAWLFTAEALLLAAFWVAGRPILAARPQPGTAPFVLVVALAGAAMGIQNATLTHFGPLTVRTTHVTGTLAEFADKLAEAILGRGKASEAVLLAFVWLAYAGSAALGVLAEMHWGLTSMSIPIGVIAAVAVALVGVEYATPRKQKHASRR